MSRHGAVVGDPVDPGFERSRFLEARELANDGDPNLLENIFRLFRRRDDPANEVEKPRVVASEEREVRFSLAKLSSHHDEAFEDLGFFPFLSQTLFAPLSAPVGYRVHSVPF